MTHKSIASQLLPACLAVLMLSQLTLVAQETDSVMATQAEYYRISSVPTPENVVLEVGDFEFMPDGRLAASSRRGDIYMFADPLQPDASKIKSKLFMDGLHEVLGLSYRDGSLYATQRGEVTRLTDENKDGLADICETVSAGWGINGDYHEYAFGSKFDSDGDMWVTLCLTGSFTSENKYRGWCLRISPDGTVTPTCSGLRSPGGIDANAEGDMFYTDNQGPWNGTCGLKWLRKGSFQGNPKGNDWYTETDAIGPRPLEPVSGSRIMTEAKKIPELEPTAILFPYKKMGQSAAGLVCDTSNGKFGPFENQMFVCDQTFSWVMRVDLEKVKGHYQGACFPFTEGFNSGNLAIDQAENGMMFVGGTNRGWGSRGKKNFALERLEWTGKTPFEVKHMKARHDGFELTFTKPVDPATAGNLASYTMPTYTYIYQESYGSPEVDHVDCTITKAVVAADGLSVRLHVDKLHEGHVHELHLDGVKSAEGKPLWHPVGYYTLNYLPAAN
ncbi:MAG: hypothetical protein ACI87E_002047 [Mariniblastus sp.]|jgi:hypothetical protein